ncbi:SCP2 sterol-binding domain-containing protein [Patulibacter minatonensis]|uniref:SCP2 sterol-binding domain-containing protein n=1 Tax=Patulibacter minatonensis TaxID=298163 RepID=UPI00047E6213|nr:SCP2 sterol-binding domain-containing protein [Patulibacter minatonensis]
MLDPEHPPDASPQADGSDRGLPAGVVRFVEDVEGALEDEQAAKRLALARVRVQIDVTDADVSVLLLLDRDPPAVVVGRSDQRPNVRLSISSGDLGAMLSEGSHLPMAILAGDVVFEGAVRKLLRVLPILRAAADGARWTRENRPDA